MNELFPLPPSVRPGFRLHKLEVSNWGTFDSTDHHFHAVYPAGQTTLLIGQNGSGKSTLVDALLTLLVKPGVRNFNVAAGAKKRERDERTYIKGAYGRMSQEDDSRANIQYLRPKGSHYTVILACFRNEDIDRTFTIAQLLYLNSDNSAEKVYCFAQDERSIRNDFSGLTATDKVLRELRNRGFRATRKFKEYKGWFDKATGVRSKAMDMFNQTVAVKDIQSLDEFIRNHMLEAQPWNERVDALLNHFTQLSEAHASLMRVRQQSELLLPIAEVGATYREQAAGLEQAICLRDAADSFFLSKTVELFTPELTSRQERLKQTQRKKDDLTVELKETRRECHRIQNEIEQAGGDRLKQIPLLIESAQGKAKAKREDNRRHHDCLQNADISETVETADDFQRIHQSLPARIHDLNEHITAGEGERDELVIERANVKRQLSNDRLELEALTRRQGNLPEYLVQLRQHLCNELGIAAKDIPFAAELIAVESESREWEASIEKVLHGFALSLLVPQRLYRVVSSHVDSTRLVDTSGRGQRLVYLRVGERTEEFTRPASHTESLLRKLEFRQGQPLLPWVQAELQQRFDYRCCETIEEFQQARGLALTNKRHVKSGATRHDKDDRDRVVDPRNFILGWDNREKRRRLAEEIERLQEQENHLGQKITSIEQRLEANRVRQNAVESARQFTAFSQIDYATHEAEVHKLNEEKRQLEENNDTIQILKQSLATAEMRETALQVSRDEMVATGREIENHITEAKKLIDNAQAELRRRQADGSFARHAKSFVALDGVFSQQPLTCENLFAESSKFKQKQAVETDRLRDAVDPLKGDLVTAMAKFLQKFSDERQDLIAKIDYLDSFLGLQQQIAAEDLPRHEQRFKERLNEKVIQDIGMLNGKLETDRREIEDKIEQLNQSLQKLEYRPGTHMRLEPRLVRDEEITRFRSAIQECLAGTFEGSPEADEARFLRIQELIGRLRDEDRWRNKVTDVRRWFNFAAREIDSVTGEERAYYEDSTGQSGGEKAKLAFTILVAAIAYQYDIDPERPVSDRFHFVVVDEMFSKVDDQYAEYALNLFKQFGLQLLIVAPLDAKARVTEQYVGCYLHVVKDAKSNRSEIYSMTAREFEEAVEASGNAETAHSAQGNKSEKIPR